jgi:hypothetical protein
MIGDVQSWANNPANNFGWELISETENTATTIRRFGSLNDAANAPTLVIDFTPVPEPGALSLFAIAGMGLWMAARRRRNEL